MKPSTRDRTEGKLHEVKGKIKEEIGRATNNRDLEVSGNAEKNAGKVQKWIGRAKKGRRRIADLTPWRASGSLPVMFRPKSGPQSTQPASAEQHRDSEGGWAREITMHIRFIRTLLFGLVMLSISAASFAQIGVAITIGRPRCLSMNSLFVQATVISGHPAIGPTITTSAITTWCRPHG